MATKTLRRDESFLRFGKETDPVYAELNRRVFDGKLDSIHLFMLAMTYGAMKGRRSQGFTRAPNGPRTAVRSEHKAMMSAVQLMELGDNADLLNHEERDLIAEEFAEGGIRLLKEKLDATDAQRFLHWLLIEIGDSRLKS